MGRLMFIIFLIAGALVTVLTDRALGFSYEGIPWWANFTHKLVYMMWGSILYRVSRARREE